MHYQIKAIIATFRLIGDGKVYVDFSSGEQTAMGHVLNDMYYNTRLTSLLDRGDSDGYPHNGGRHSFYLTCKPLDAIAFIETVKETLQDKRTRDEEHRQVISELSYISQELHAFRRLHK